MSYDSTEFNDNDLSVVFDVLNGISDRCANLQVNSISAYTDPASTYFPSSTRNWTSFLSAEGDRKLVIWFSFWNTHVFMQISGSFEFSDAMVVDAVVGHFDVFCYMEPSESSENQSTPNVCLLDDRWVGLSFQSSHRAAFFSARKVKD